MSRFHMSSSHVSTLTVSGAQGLCIVQLPRLRISSDSELCSGRYSISHLPNKHQPSIVSRHPFTMSPFVSSYHTAALHKYSKKQRRTTGDIATKHPSRPSAPARRAQAPQQARGGSRARSAGVGGRARRRAARPFALARGAPRSVGRAQAGSGATARGASPARACSRAG